MQIPTANHWTEVRDPYGRVRGRIEEAEGDGNPIGRTTVSSYLDTWEAPRDKATNQREYIGWSTPPPQNM